MTCSFKWQSKFVISNFLVHKEAGAGRYPVLLTGASAWFTLARKLLSEGSHIRSLSTTKLKLNLSSYLSSHPCLSSCIIIVRLQSLNVLLAKLNSASISNVSSMKCYIKCLIASCLFVNTSFSEGFHQSKAISLLHAYLISL